jgi:hypothetical protein
MVFSPHITAECRLRIIEHIHVMLHPDDAAAKPSLFRHFFRKYLVPVYSSTYDSVEMVNKDRQLAKV